jgi:hypothetical protein
MPEAGHEWRLDKHLEAYHNLTASQARAFVVERRSGHAARRGMQGRQGAGDLCGPKMRSFPER